MKSTEKRNPRTTHIDKATTKEMLTLINDENLRSFEAVGEAIDSIAAAVDCITEAIREGGRLIYVGAGTSGRLASQDAAECPPTYGVDYNTVLAVVAGGPSALVKAAENVEDNGDAGIAALKEISVCGKDVVMGISASGNAKFVADAMNYAKSLGAKTVSLSSNDDALIGEIADFPIFCDTGAEVITGSTRMKAGNAQKMVMNMITTSVMIKLGKVYENMMINLKPTNIKLRDRMIRIVLEILPEIDYAKAESLLEENGFFIPAAVEAYKRAIADA